jgi:hypothetical protein
MEKRDLTDTTNERTGGNLELASMVVGKPPNLGVKFSVSTCSSCWFAYS